MASLTLHYGADPATGLPRLEDPGGRLAGADLALLGREVARSFERLVGGIDGDLLTLDGPVPPHLPRRFRVHVTDRQQRCPTLLLEAVDHAEPAAESAPAAPGRWQAEFLGEVAELLAKAGDGNTLSPLDFVLSDLRALLRKDPRRFTLLLLAGYLHVGDALSLRHGAGGANRYAQAAGALARLAGSSLPAGTLDALLEADEGIVNPREQSLGWLRRFFSFS